MRLYDAAGGRRRWSHAVLDSGERLRGIASFAAPGPVWAVALFGGRSLRLASVCDGYAPAGPGRAP